MKKAAVTWLIDDDRMFTYITTKQLRTLALCDDIQVFNDGDDAVRYLQEVVETPEKLPTVILLDINMPVLDGWQFLDRMRSFDLSRNIIIYIVSSSIDQADQLKAATYKEVSNFYVKPISKDDLRAMFHRLHDAD